MRASPARRHSEAPGVSGRQSTCNRWSGLHPGAGIEPKTGRDHCREGTGSAGRAGGIP
jgi:hypothetical protein